MIVFMGIAGSGKGTQTKLLAKNENYQVISTGELLRINGSDDQHRRMLTGEILGDQEVTVLLDKALQALPDQNKVLIDGYPRRITQAQWLLQQQAQGRFVITHIIHLTATRQTATNRLTERGRLDDRHQAIEERFNKYEEATLPIFNYFLEAGIPVADIDAERSIEAVHSDIVQAIHPAPS